PATVLVLILVPAPHPMELYTLSLHDALPILRERPEAPAGVPDSFSEHVKLMFDLQVLAFASDLTRVFAFKLGRDASNRAFPESGDRKSTRLNSSHLGSSYAVFCLKKKRSFYK